LNLYPHLFGQKASKGLSNSDMAKIVGLSSSSYSQKVKSGKFTLSECQALCQYFNKPFDYLFKTEVEISIEVVN